VADNLKNNILKALFDIKPVDEAGRVDVEKIQAVSLKLDLSKQGQRAPLRKVPFVDFVGDQKPEKNLNKKATTPYQLNYENQNPVSMTSQVVSTCDVKTLLEKYLNLKLNIGRELKMIGAKVEKGSFNAKPRYRPIFAKQKSELITSQAVKPINNFASHVDLRSQDYQTILSQINQRVASEVDDAFVGEPKKIDPFEYWNEYGLTTSQIAEPTIELIDDFASPVDLRSRHVNVRPSPEIESWVRYATKNTRTDMSVLGLNLNIRHLATYVLIGLLAFVILISFGWYGISVKNEIVKEGNSAVASLEQAEKSLKVFDFESASNNFTEAYSEFSKAGDNLNSMGAGLTSLFAESLDGFNNLTAGKLGTSKLKSAKNLIEAGKLLAEVGNSMSETLSYLSETVAVLNVKSMSVEGGPPQGRPPQSLAVGSLKQSLLASSKNLSKANALLSDVSPDALPEDKRESFLKFRSKLPELEGIVSDAVEYTYFLENLLGPNGTKKYLILFQNNSELRPTGGFFGTYSVVTFKDGQFAEFLVDDVYNLDGQLKENIIPPKPLQHITPTWGMRDANWFIDFSASAQKIIQFYEKITGKTCTGLACNEINGVITMSPRMISEILKIVGPVEMPEYNLVVDDENFLSAIQAEVEYGDNREQPKQIIKDIAPKLLEKIYSASSGDWLAIFDVFMGGLEKKDVLMYFRDLSLESFIADKGFGGLIKKTGDDYLMVTLTNVKGSKTDKMIENSIKLDTRFENGKIIHKMELTRQHNGGSTEYGFYNKQNPAYVRVLVPKGSKFLNISGNSNPEYTPLVVYSEGNFKQDEDLYNFESSFNLESKSGVSSYSETDKTGFAFWMITDPGKQKTVILEYEIPANFSNNNYGIYIQKQPGLDMANLKFTANGFYVYNGEFDKDLELRFKAE